MTTALSPGGDHSADPAPAAAPPSRAGATNPSYVLVLSRRPSMPPGGRDLPAKGGMHDFAWVIFDTLRPDYPTEVRWLL